MNPYLAVSLVMCGVIVLSLAATAYMAVYFTRRARADLELALAPLAAAIDGQANVEDAVVEGRHNRKLAFGRMAHAEGGPVRVFQTELIDAAGGDRWLFVAYPEKGTTEFHPHGSPMFQDLPVLRREGLATALGVEAEWFQIDYSAEGGYVRLSVPMATRKAIPGDDVFRRQLDILDTLSNENRRLQERMNVKGTGPGE